MGWFTNYEIEFEDNIEWDDQIIKHCLKDFTVDYLYLRDMEKSRVILCVYSQNPLEKIILALKNVYDTGITYRIYNSNEAWTRFEPAS
jgi:hypothetical protein